jgi:transglutaminase-like putative cysteine protease
MNLTEFLKENEYINYSFENIVSKAQELFKGIKNDIEKAKIAFEYVRDEIPHSFDIKSKIITARASDVLEYKTGICHAKSNLLAGLLRFQNIPTGFCFQHITLADDDSIGYCVHCFNAIYVHDKWIKVDARGNTNGRNAQLSLDKPILAFTNRNQYDEYFWNGIYASPHMDTMKMLDNAKNLQDILNNIPDYVNEVPDIAE